MTHWITTTWKHRPLLAYSAQLEGVSVFSMIASFGETVQRDDESCPWGTAHFWLWENKDPCSAKISAIFNEKIEIRERCSFSSFSGLFWPGSFSPSFRLWIPKRCKGVHCVDLGESFPTSIYLQNLASIQPRTSLFHFFDFYPASVI